MPHLSRRSCFILGALVLLGAVVLLTQFPSLGRPLTVLALVLSLLSYLVEPPLPV